MDEEEKKAIMNFIAIRMNMKQIMVMVLLVLAVSVTFSQNVTNVSFHQEGNKVVITYDLDKTADISVYMSSNGGKSFGDALQHVSGAVGKHVSAGMGKRIEYDALADYDKLQGENFVFKVNAVSCPATVSDYDGNRYQTVLIGDQCWMKENLRTTHYSDGTSISLGGTTSITTAYRYYPNNNSGNVKKYGYLYNWPAVMRNASSISANPSGVLGICPTGWHVPSDAEWMQLANYVGGQSQYVCGGNNSNIAKALASTTEWSSSSNTCAVGNTPFSNNATDFSIVPAGYYSNLGFTGFGRIVYFWSSTQVSKFNAYSLYLYCDYAIVYSHDANKYLGYSVRCLRD